MKEYIVNDNIKIIHGDAYEFLNSYKVEGPVTLITDPPYGIAKETNFHTMLGRSRVGMQFDKETENAWDHDVEFDWICLLPNILKENSNVVIFNCWENLGMLSDLCSQNHITIKRPLVLSKTNPAPFNCKRMFVSDSEFAVWGVYNSKNKPTLWTFNSEKMKDAGHWENFVHKTVLQTKVQSSKYHPTMKDIKIIKYLIELLSEDDATIIDPFGGCFTTAAAVLELNNELENSNRKFIGCELENLYIENTKQRFKDEYGIEIKEV